jgi:sugar phosphate isomerase/epimerase
MRKEFDLMCLYWTTAGIVPGEGEISPYDLRDRVKSAAKAGFKGIGLWHTDLEHCMMHRSLKEMKAILDDNGMKYLELEFLTDWFVAGGRKWESDNRKKRLFEASAALGAKHVKIGDFYNTPCTMEQAVEAFANLCTEAERYGATIGFEFMVSSMLNSLESALEMVKTVGARNGGLIIDIVQAEALKIPHEKIADIPIRYLVNIELDDGALPGSPLYDSSRMRRFCGEGDFDAKGFVNAIRKTGYTGPWAVEVMSKELAALPLDELNRRAFDTTMAVLV